MWTTNSSLRGSFWFPVFFFCLKRKPRPLTLALLLLLPMISVPAQPETKESRPSGECERPSPLSPSLPLSQWGSKPPPAVFAQLSWSSRPVRFIHSFFFPLRSLNSSSLRLLSDSLSCWSKPIYNCCVFLFSPLFSEQRGALCCGGRLWLGEGEGGGGWVLLIAVGVRNGQTLDQQTQHNNTKPTLRLSSRVSVINVS